MLKEISIRHFKLLEDTRLEFRPGLNVLTGETGAGKTQCLEALRAALGARLGEDVISRHAESAEVTAVFDLSGRPDILKSLAEGGWLDGLESEVILERTVERHGPSRGRLNGRRVPIGTLQEIGERIVDLLGQNARADIINRPALEILDLLGDKNHRKIVDRVKDLYSEWKNLNTELENLKSEISLARERRELAEFQFAELEKAGLSEGEEVELTREAELLSKTRERIELSGNASELLNSDKEEITSVRDILQSVLDLVENLAEIDPSVAQDAEKLGEMVFTAEELADNLAKYSTEITDNPERREWVEERLGVIHNLKRKYRIDESGLISMWNRLSDELNRVATAGDRLLKIEKKSTEAREQYLSESRKLSASRKKLATRIGREVKNHLGDLDLPSASFEFRLESSENHTGDFRPDGIDRAEILIATNPSHSPAPLRKVASGGELSRLLIAMKTVLAERDRVPVLVFDEAEAGIGGETAFKVGEKLKELSRSHQLILVSHLPQIAGMASTHWVITKHTDGKRTTSVAGEVRDEERVREIERMLGSRGDRGALQKLAMNMLGEDR